MSKTRNRHTEKFKREAVRLMLSRGERTVGDVARSVGVTEGDLPRRRDKKRPRPSSRRRAREIGVHRGAEGAIPGEPVRSSVNPRYAPS